MSIADLFIIESLSNDDESTQRFEGQRLASLLTLCGKNPRYFYFRSKDELPHIVKLFELSEYRYLHISCHGSDSIVQTTSETLAYKEFASYFKGSLKLKRVFLSACELGSEIFSESLASVNKGMHSVVAPAEPIEFDHAAAIWGAFYVSAFAKDMNKMNSKDIVDRFRTLCTLFPVDFHVSTYNPKLDKWKHTRLQKMLSKPSPKKQKRSIKR